jgi:hypothetical protein
MSGDSAKQFEEFLQRQKAFEADAVDWNARKENWLMHLNDLYQSVEQFLADYISSGDVVRRYRDVALHEEDLGAYRAREMVLQTGRQEIILHPIGTILIGALGRVDMTGPAGTVRFVLVARNASGPRVQTTVGAGNKMRSQSEPAGHRVESEVEWKISTPPPQISYVELTKESLLSAIMEVVNG